VVSRPIDRKDAIAHAAAKLFAERGFAAVGMDDLGAAVGITGPAIYRHFVGKDAVLETVVLDLLDEFVRQADAVEAVTPGATGRDSALDRLVTTSVSVALSHPSQVATDVRERGRLTGAAAGQAAVQERHLRAIWERLLRLDVPSLPSELVAVRQQAVLAATGAMTAQRGRVTRPRLGQLLVDGSLRMMRMPPAAPTTGLAQVPEPEWLPQVSRRETILNAALTLFRAKGYHGVGMDEIGEAAGISGPAIYRHYVSKADILLDAYDRAGSRVAVGVEVALEGAASPLDALRRLISSYVTIASDNVNLIMATREEGASLPKAERPRLLRQQRDIAERWARIVAELRPDLSESEVRSHVGCVFPMVNHVVQLPARELDRGPELEALAEAFLLT
jgi:AcrR family transcriptional regulator